MNVAYTMGHFFKLDIFHDLTVLACHNKVTGQGINGLKKNVRQSFSNLLINEPSR